MITFEETVDYLGEDNTLEDTIGLLVDIANGVYSPEQLKQDIKDHKEHQ